MELHIIIRPKSKASPDAVIRAGIIQFSKWCGSFLQPKSTANLWWKRSYLHARVHQTTSLVKLEIPANQFSRLLHFGFEIDLLKGNEPITQAKFSRDETLNRVLTIQINLEKILTPPSDQANTPRILILKKPVTRYPSAETRY